MRSRPSYFLLINACTEIGCGGLGAFVALGEAEVLGRPGVAEGDCVGADAAIDVGDEACCGGAVVGWPALQATRTRAAGSTQSAFTQPVFLWPIQYGAVFILAVLNVAGGELMSERSTGRSQGIGPDPGTSSPERGNWAARHDLLLYFTLAYLLSWALWPLVILNPTSSPLVPFEPLIAAVIVSLLAGGPKELWALLRQLTRWRVHPIWYLIALLGPFVLAVIAAALAVAAGAPMRRSGAYTDLGAVSFTPAVDAGHRRAFRRGGLARFRPPQAAASPRRYLGCVTPRCHLGSLHLPELISDPTRQRPPLQFVYGPWRCR